MDRVYEGAQGGSGRLVVASGTGKPTMSSREIADLLGCDHKVVKLSIQRLIDRGVVNMSPLVTYSTGRRGRPGYEYRDGKRDSYVIVPQ
jgi:predicted ArsR family transcriptional regulator